MVEKLQELVGLPPEGSPLGFAPDLVDPAEFLVEAARECAAAGAVGAEASGPSLVAGGRRGGS